MCAWYFWLGFIAIWDIYMYGEFILCCFIIITTRGLAYTDTVGDVIMD